MKANSIQNFDRLTTIPFYATAAFFFLALTLLFLAVPVKDLSGHYFNPPLLALVHTAALGWGTMVIFGAAYQLIPVIFERTLYSPLLALASYVSLTLGTILLIYTFWVFQSGALMIAAGSLVVLASICYNINVFLTARCSAKKTDYPKAFLLSSALWLLLTTIIGLLLAINLYHTFIPRNHLDILKLHAHVGLAGWFLQLITGASIKLIPMFLMGKSDKRKLISLSFILQNTGLFLFLVDGYFNPISGRFFYYAIIVGVGIICWIRYLFDVYHSRLRRHTEVLMRQSSLSFVSLIVALLALPASYFFSSYKWTSLYAVLLFLGWISALIMGQTFKTLPFVVWKLHYGKTGARQGIPLPKQLYSERLLVFQYYLFIIALSTLCLALVLESHLAIRLSLMLWLALAVIYLCNVLKVLFHKPTMNHANSSD